MSDLYNGKFLTLDFEVDTSHGDFGHPAYADNHLLLACWRVQGEATRSLWGNELQMGPLLDDLDRVDFIVAHNAKYELGWLERCGYDISSLTVFCTKLAEYVRFGNLCVHDHKTGLAPLSTSLDACCQRRGWEAKDPVVDQMMKSGTNPKEIPRQWLEGRCRQDVDTTERLFLDQRDLLQRTGRLGVLYTRSCTALPLAATENVGVHLDADRVKEVHDEYEKQAVSLERKMQRAASGINWRSPMQVADHLYTSEDKGGLGFDELRRRDGTPIRTAAGRKKADKSTVDSLVATTQKQKEFLKLRAEIGKNEAALSKSLRFYRGVVDHHDSLFFASFNNTRTSTHRLSSSGHKIYVPEYEREYGAQLQNQARQFKKLYTARNEGWLMMEVDGAQIEFRVAAQLGGPDKQALTDITDPDFDAHCTSASAMQGIPYEEFLEGYRAGDEKFKKWRTQAKVDTFKPLYGGESGTKKQKRWYKAFKERYYDIAVTQEAWVEKVLQDKYLTTPWGLTFFWPRAKRMPDGWVNVKSSVYNYPIQCLATAEIIPIALYELWLELYRDPQVLIVNTVHDSVILEVHPEAVDRVRKIAVECFGAKVYTWLEEVYGMQFEVPLGCGINVGTHWSEGDEETYNIWPHDYSVAKVA